jgi:RHS repeat-associated protein
MKKKSSAPLLLIAILLLCSIVGLRAAADPAPTGVKPEELAAATTPEEPTAENARIVDALPGVRRIGVGETPGATAFQFVLGASPETISRAFLVYELAGVPHWTATVRSINGLPAEGGFGATPTSGTALQMEEINPRWLRQGVNQIFFFPAPAGELAPSGLISLRQQKALAAPDAATPYTVRNLRLVYLDGTGRPAPRLRLSHPLQGENDDAGTELRGFVEPAGLPTGPAELFVDGVYVPDGVEPADGSFAVFVPRSAPAGEAWEAEIEVVYPDGSRLRKTVRLAGETRTDDRGSDDSAELDADSGSAKSLALGKARLDVTPGALAGKVKLSLRGLRHEELPALDSGMTNVTPGQGGFRMGPHGLRFKKPVELRLPYDAALIPQGMTLEDVRTFFFDEEAGRWVPLPLAAQKAAGDVIASLTDHFTDFINATLALPDEPAGANYSPNSLQDLAKADPAAAIVQIEPPEGGPTGDALLDFPLVVPPGRHGMEPDLAVHYDSSGGDGWLGLGWDLRLPSIEISTLFGVPRYDGSERYLVDGEQLAPTSEPGVFVRRVEGSFERIIRHGSRPDDFWWEVTDKDGTRSVFGQAAEARLRDPHAGNTGNTFRWYLQRTVDLHGNTVDYSYATDSGSNGEPWIEVYPARIDYTGAQGAGAFYHVRFTLDDGGRPDRLSSGRPGFKTYTRHRLAAVDVLAGDALVRRYLFQYQVGAFGKSLLQSIAVTGEDGTTELYRHQFKYMPGEAAFGQPVAWGSLPGAVSGDDTQSFSAGGHGFVGIGDPSCANHVGPQIGGGGGFLATAQSFLDVNGDGLPDRIAQDGTVAINHFDPVQGRGGFSGTGTFDGATTLEHTQQFFFDLGAGLHAAEELAVVGVNWSWNHGNDDRAVADVNGDGLPDLVGSGAVRFNDGSRFSTAEVPFAGGGFDFSIPGERNDVLGRFNLSDPLRKLVLPFDGTVRILGAIQKKDPEPGHDGVTVEIHHNGSRVWKRTIAAADLTACTPAAGDACGDGLTLQVTAGDRLYFLAGSIARTDHDALLWAPRVTYTSAVLSGHSQDVSGRGDVDSSGAPLFVFDARDDFRLAGYPPSGGEVLSGGYHGWFYGEWNGDQPFRESGLQPPAGQSEQPLYLAAQPNPQGVPTIPGLTVPAWTAAGFDLYITADGVKPSRRGGDVLGRLDAADAAPGEGVDLVRKNTSATVGFDAGAAGFGAAVSCGASDTQLDLIDLNGDLYPDQVAGGSFLSTALGDVEACGGLTVPGDHADGSVRLADGRGGFAGSGTFSGLLSPVRRTADVTLGLNFGLGINIPRKNGKGQIKSVGSVMPSVGETLALSQTTTDLVDVNGDGLPDRVAMDPGANRIKVRLNLGYRFGAEEDWQLPAWSDGTASCHDVANLGTGELGDLTSFGSFDALRHESSAVGNAGVAFGPVGGGAGTTLSRTLVDLVDVNGDGLPDHVARDEDGAFRVKINYGDRWGSEQTWSDPAWPGSALDHHASLFQCLDAIRSTGDVNGNGSIGAPICISLRFVGIQIEISAQGAGGNGGGELAFEDFDGDGLADRVLKGSDSTVYVKQNQAAKANLLAEVDRPLGSTTTLDYRRQGNRVDRSDPAHRIDMPTSQWVLASTVVADGRGHEYRTDYDYFDDAFFDRSERESYGYARVRTTLPDGSTIDRSYQNQDLYGRYLMTKEAVADAAGNLFQVKTSRYDERPVAAGSRFPALVAEATAFYEGSATTEGTPPKSTAMTYEYDARGNVVRSTDFADLGGADDLTVAIAYQTDDTSWLTRPVSVQVRDGSGRLLRGRQGSFNAAGDLVRLEQTLAGGRDPQTGAPYAGGNNPVWSFTYDELGNLASSVDPTGYTSTYVYDGTVRTYPAEVRDSFGYLTRYAYDLKYGDLAETIDENGNAVRRAYDPFGRLAKVVGPYDSDAAPTLAFEYGPGAPVSWAVVHHKDVTRADPIDSAVFIDSLERVLETKEDGELDLGSGASTRTGMRVSGSVEFDAKGRLAAQGQPVFDDSPANRFVDVAARNPTTFSYDALDRVRAVRFSYGAVTRIDYAFGALDGLDRFLTVRTDPNGRITRFYRDVWDNALGVEQTNTIAGARKTLVTRYAYDALSQLTTATDAKGNATRLEYDTLGRRVTVDSPDLGRTESRFDPAGNLKARITANLAAAGQQIRYLYTFDRLEGIDYPQSPDVTFTYGGPGAPFNRANRIAAVVDESGREERSYGKLGEIVQTVKTATALNGATPKGPYTTRFQFDSFNRLLAVVFPDGETLTYGFDAGGNVKSASGVLQGVRFDYLRHLGYDEFGDRARMALGNGVETRYTYDPQSRFLAQLRTTGAGRDLQNLRYQYDLTGTLQAIQNDVPVPSPSLSGGPASQTFQYDDLYQLVGAQGTYRTGPNKVSTYALALGYDELGNTVAKNQLHQTGSNGKLNVEKKTTYDWAYAYGGPQPHAPTHVGDRSFRYDRDGNQIGWDSDGNGTRRTLSWDEEDRLLAVADNGQTTRFLYGADGTRTNKAGQHGETIYVNRWFTLRNGAIASKHVFADDLRLATKVSPNPNPASEKVYFYQGDHLGSTHFVTDESGAVYQHLEYFPSGEAWVDERSETQRTPYLFSGKELDEETGLADFGFRYYDARQGQWISPDPVLDDLLAVDDLADPSLSPHPFHLPGHVYGYTGNDPVDLFDPDGLGKYIKIEYKNGVVREIWDKSEIMKRYPKDYKQHLADIRLKARRANAQIKKLNKSGKQASTNVGKSKVKTASLQWVKANWKKSYGPVPTSVRKGLNVLRKRPFPQDVDEFLTRLHGGQTIQQNSGDNQGPLSSFINQTHGAAMGQLGNSGKPRVIKKFVPVIK